MYTKQESILESELVLIYIDEQPAFYARVEAITADVKPKWWRVKFLFLTVPAKIATWIIDDEQIRGADFTMGGTPIRIEKLTVPASEIEEADPAEENKLDEQTGSERKARVLSLHTKQT